MPPSLTKRPYYLTDVSEALYLDPVSNEVAIRTGITGNINISGNVTIPGDINANVYRLGNIDISNTYMPIDGNVVVTGGNIEVTQGTDPWMVEGNVNAVVTQGTDPWMVEGNIIVTGGNITTTVDPAEKTAFQEPLAITITPVIQADGVYGLDPDIWGNTELNGGNITTTGLSTWQVNSGTSAGGYARLATNKYMTYQPGQGSMFRWTASFTANDTNKNALGVANIVQTTGPIDREDGYAIGYSGSTSTANSNRAQKLGLLHRVGGKTEIRTLTITQQNTGAQTATITLNDAVYTISLATSSSTAYCAAQIAKLLKAQTVPNYTWDIEACNNTVTFTYYSPGSKNGVYSFSSTGTGTPAAGTFARTQTGVTPSDTWTYVDQWDNQSIEFDPTKLNVWALDFRWLGAGIVRLFMEDPATGQMTLMHIQKWASTQTFPHLVNPSLRLVYRSGTTNPAITPSQNVQVSGSSVMAGIQGQISQTTSSQSYYSLDGSSRAKDVVHHVLSIQNPFVRNGGVNKGSLRLQDMSVGLKSVDPAVVYMIKNCVGTSDLLVFNPLPNTTNFNFAQYSVSVVSENLALDQISLVQTVGVGGGAQFDLLPYNFVLSPGETISLFISSTTSFNSSTVGISWVVD